MTFSKYSKINSSSSITGAEAAERMLNKAGVDNVKIEEVGGFLSDHYDPLSKTLRLSPEVFNSITLSAVGVACHEAGHAIQHKEGFAWLNLRTAMVPATNISTWVSYIIIMAGFFLASQKFILLGAIIFSAAVLFSIITLPVEWDASNRAKKFMITSGAVAEREALDASKVLNAAFLTYVAAAVSSLLTLLYYLMRAGVFGSRDD